MDRSPHTSDSGAVVAHIPGWMFLLAGVVLVSAGLLMPAWLQVRQMQWQHRIMQLQAEQLERQASGYQQFNAALDAEDPILLQRLAYHYLGLKPAGATLIGESESKRAADPGMVCIVQASLHHPVPRAGVDLPRPQPNRSRLARLTTGRSRLALLAAGVLCLAAGVTTPTLIDRRRSS
jgi:hypothetical protein